MTTIASMGANFLMGLLAGATIFIGLPLARWRGASERLRGLLSLSAAGVLLFLIIEVGSHTIEAVRNRAETSAPQAAAGAGLLLCLGFASGLIGLAWLEQQRRHGAAAEEPGETNTLHVATAMAVGIGLHSFAEGLAIGQSFAGGQAALGTLLLIGAALHNTLEGFGIAGSLAGRSVDWARLLGLGALAGGPTALGALLGGMWVNPLAQLLFLAVSTGSLVYVLRELLRMRFERLSNVAALAALAAGLLLGFGTELVVAGAHDHAHDHRTATTAHPPELDDRGEARAQLAVPSAAATTAPAMTTLSGQPVTLEQYRGRVVLLDVWATWCPPCVAALPRLQALHNRYRAKGFSVVGVSLDEGGASTVRPFVTRRKLTYPLLLDTQGTASVQRTLKIERLPALFLIDASGRIIRRWTGEPTDAGEIEAEIINALKDQQ